MSWVMLFVDLHLVSTIVMHHLHKKIVMLMYEITGKDKNLSALKHPLKLSAMK